MTTPQLDTILGMLQPPRLTRDVMSIPFTQII